MVELDVQLSRDGEVIVLHDWTLDRTSDGRGRVGKRTLDEIRRLDAGTWFDRAYAGEHVPTLAEVLAAVRLPINVELKSQRDDGLEARTLAVVESAGALERVVFSSFDPESLVRLRALSAHADIGVLWSGRRLAPALRLAGRVGATALHIRKDAGASAEVRQAVGDGLVVRAWTVNEPAESTLLAAAGVSAIFTDFPERFLQIPPS